MNVCNVCAKSVSSRQLKIECQTCQNLFHGSCVNMSKDEVEYIVSSDEIWRCDPCRDTRRKSRQLETKIDDNQATISDVLSLLNDMRTESKAQLKKLEEDLGKSVNMCHDRIGDLVKIIEDQSIKLKVHEVNFDTLKSENTQLKKRMQELECQIEDMEQYSRANCIEINGIPEEANEDLPKIISKLGAKLGVPTEETSIDACHRLRQPRETGLVRGIIVKFNQRKIKEEILQKRRVKRNFNTRDMEIMDKPATPIYINESLSPARRRVFKAIRELQKEKRFRFVWIRNGKILVRPDEGGKVFVATTMTHVAELQNYPSNLQPQSQNASK